MTEVWIGVVGLMIGTLIGFSTGLSALLRIRRMVDEQMQMIERLTRNLNEANELIERHERINTALAEGRGK